MEQRCALFNLIFLKGKADWDRWITPSGAYQLFMAVCLEITPDGAEV